MPDDQPLVLDAVEDAAEATAPVHRHGEFDPGLVAQGAVKQKLRNGPFTPLAPATVAARASRRDKGTGKLVNSVSTRNARKYRQLQAEGVPTEVLDEAGLATPLIDTRALFNAVQYAVKG